MSMLIISNRFRRGRLESSALRRMKTRLPLDDGLLQLAGRSIRSWLLSVRVRTCISGLSRKQKNNPNPSAGTPDETDEGEQVTTFPHSHSLSQNWVSTEYQRKSPWSWVSSPQKRRDVLRRGDTAHALHVPETSCLRVSTNLRGLRMATPLYLPTCWSLLSPVTR
jgi:hypothetical protein